jgi:DNA-binding response OmpR family regulator
LLFDDKTKTIQWNEKSVQLTDKQYLLIKTIWTSDKHTAMLEEVDEKVWQSGDEKKPFTDRHTVLTLKNRAQNKLENCAFPYKIITLTNFSTRGISGYKLVCAR